MLYSLKKVTNLVTFMESNVLCYFFLYLFFLFKKQKKKKKHMLCLSKVIFAY